MWLSGNWKKQVPAAILVGIALFVLDFLYGWLTLLTGVFPMIFVIGFIVGLLAGGFNKAVGSMVLVLLIGLGIGFLLIPMVLEGIFDPDSIIFGQIFATMFWPIRGTYYSMFGVSGAEAILGFIAIIFIAPLIYLLSLIAATLGGIIGGILQRQLTGHASVGTPTRSSPNEE